MKLTSLNRWKAAAIHLGLSALIAATVVTIMLLVWYPPPYFSAMGGQDLLKILIGVDVTLGPLLTLIIFDPAKKSLRFDLSVIAALQIAALAYGVFVMFEARPVYTVFAVDRFDVVSANQLEAEDLAAGSPEYRELPLTGPRVVGLRPPDQASNPDEWNKYVFSALGGKDAPQFPKYYVPYVDIADVVLKKAKPLAELAKGKPATRAIVQEFVDRSARAEGEFVFVPFVGRGDPMTAVLDARDAKIAGILPIDPY
jgi:hypothetical protein